MKGVCDNCKRMVGPSKLTTVGISGASYCDTCFIDLGYALCDTCGATAKDGEFTDVNGLKYCRDCVEKGYAK